MLQFLGVSLSGLSSRDQVPKLLKLDEQEALREKIQRSRMTQPKKCSPIIPENKLKGVCLYAKTIVNKKRVGSRY